MLSLFLFAAVKASKEDSSESEVLIMGEKPEDLPLNTEIDTVKTDRFVEYRHCKNNSKVRINLADDSGLKTNVFIKGKKLT